MPQPILELGNVHIDHPRDVGHASLCDAALNQESNKPPHAAHVFCRQATVPTAAAACARMSCKSSDDAVVDVTNCDLRAVQPRQNDGHRLRNPSQSVAYTQGSSGAWRTP